MLLQNNEHEFNENSTHKILADGQKSHRGGAEAFDDNIPFEGYDFQKLRQLNYNEIDNSLPSMSFPD